MIITVGRILLIITVERILLIMTVVSFRYDYTSREFPFIIALDGYIS